MLAVLKGRTMLSELPVKVLLHIVKFSEFHELVIFYQVCRNLQAKIAPMLHQLRSYYHSLVGQSSASITQASVHSLMAARAVFMSNLLYRLDHKQLGLIASTSHEHAKLVFSNPSVSRNNSYRNLLVQVAKDDLRFAELMIKQNACVLSKSQWLRIAKSSHRHAALVLQCKESKRKLTEKSYLELAETSPRHTRLVYRMCFVNFNYQHLDALVKMEIEHDYEVAISEAISDLLKLLPVWIAAKRLAATHTLLTELLNDTFFDLNKHIIKHYRATEPEMTANILAAYHWIKRQDCYDDFMSAIIIGLMEISPQHASIVLNYPGIAPRMLGDKERQALEKLAKRSDEYSKLIDDFLQRHSDSLTIRPVMH